MTMTPWGNSEHLRERRLPPGPATPREQVIANQRERLFGALVATVAQKGYEATTVADLAGSPASPAAPSMTSTPTSAPASRRRCGRSSRRWSGWSGKSVAARDGELAWSERARAGLGDFATLVAGQGAAARMCLIDVYAAGPEAVAEFGRAVSAFEALVGELVAESPERAGIPAPLIAAAIGALQEIARRRLWRGEEDELAALVDQLWAVLLSYRPSPAPLRRPQRRAALRGGAADGAAIVAHTAAERVLDGLAREVAESGYAETSVARVARRAGVSTNTFYAHFAGREEAMAGAIDLGAAQLMAGAMAAARRAGQWPEEVRGALAALLAHLAARPALGRLLFVAAYAAGAGALARREAGLEPLAGLIARGEAHAPGTPAVAVELILGGVIALAARQLAEDPAGLVGLGPLLTYYALSPYLGPERACAVANGEGRRAEP